MTPLQTFLARVGLDQGNGHVPRITTTAGRNALCELFAAQGYTRGAEVGVWLGLFSERICRAVPGVELLCVDPWQSYDAYRDAKNDRGRLEAAYTEAVTRLAPYHATIMRMSSLEAAARVPDGSLDFVFLDGNHAASFVRADLEAWSPKVRSGGVLSGHDYTSRSKLIDVKTVVDKFTAERGITPWFVLAADKYPSFWWMQP